MSQQIILNVITGIAGVLALIGLGGAFSLLGRQRKSGSDQRAPEQRVQITVKQGEGPEQTVTLPQDSAVVEQLTKVQGIQIPDRNAVTDDDNADSQRDRRPEIIGLITSVIAALGAGLPFVVAGELFIATFALAGAALGALLLTSAGVVVNRLKTTFTRDEWKARSTKMHVEAIRDAALLRDLSSQSKKTINLP